MTRTIRMTSALFRDRDFFVHDGNKLRRFTIPAYTQMIAALTIGLLLAFSTFSVVRFLSPAAPALTVQVPIDIARLPNIEAIAGALQGFLMNLWVAATDEVQRLAGNPQRQRPWTMSTQIVSIHRKV